MRRPRRTLLSSRRSWIFGCSQSGRRRARELGRKGGEELLGVDRQRRRAAGAAARGARRAAVVQQLVELERSALARDAEQVEEVRRAVLAGVAEAVRDPVEVAVVGRQDVRLLVVEVLDAVLDAAQQRVGVAQARAGAALHQAAGDELVERLQRRARADLGEVAAANDEQQLDDELDLADPAARQLDVVGALGPAGGAPLRLVAHLDVELAQALEDAVVEIAAIDEGGDERLQRQRATALDARARRDDPALQPGEALPLAAVRLQVVLEHRQARHRRARVAVRAQREVDAEDEAVLGDVADQRIEAARDLREVLVRADRCRARGRAPGRSQARPRPLGGQRPQGAWGRHRSGRSLRRRRPGRCRTRR